MEKCILSLDQGTSSSRAIVFDHAGNVLSVAQKEFTQHFPRPGWVEHDAREIWATEAAVMTEAVAMAGLSGGQVAGIGITNQRETTVVWDARTGEPICHAIVWQDRRTADYCDSLKAQGLTARIREKTGLIIDAYFSATKVRWILENIPGARSMADAGYLRFGTVDSWLVWNLTGGKVHVTDVSNASRTMLFNINTLQWDAALFGQMCTEPGSVKNTYGTGCFLLMNSGSKPILSANNLLTTVAWKIGDRTDYALEGSIFVGGSVVQWLRDGLGIIGSSSEVEALAASVPDNGGVYFVPALTGMGAPYWDPYAKGGIHGITRGTTAAHIARAALEGIAFQTMDIVRAMERDAGVHLSELKVDGGASRNNLLMQFQADILGAAVIRPRVTETTALGACYLAGLAVGYWNSIDEIKGQWQVEKAFSPQADPQRVSSLCAGWADAIGRTVNCNQ